MNKKLILRYIFCLILVVSSSRLLWAVQAVPYPITVKQSDGTEITVRLVGNEFCHYYTLNDGTPVKRLANGDFQVMSKKEFEELKSQQRQRSIIQHRQRSIIQQQSNQDDSNRKANKQTTEGFPAIGSLRSLVILVSFADVSFKTENAQHAFSDLLNKEGYDKYGATGSAADYFLACSNNQFQPQFDVVGPYTLSHNMSYYGANGRWGDTRAGDMIVEACSLASKDVDFSLYDYNNDDYIDNVFVFFAGYDEAQGGSEDAIWSHRSYIMSYQQYDGKYLGDYACTAELRGYNGARMAGIGTFCHEFGHVLGLPDLYNTSDNSGSGYHYTVGEWDIMASGAYNNDSNTPPVYSAFERFMLGWLVPEQLTEINFYNLPPLETDNKAYLVAATDHNLNPDSPSPYEYFLLENRQRVGWDKHKNCLPGVGLLVSHITFNKLRYDNNSFNDYNPLGYDIFEAYGTEYATQSSPADTYPGTYGISLCALKLNNGQLLDEKLIKNINQEENLDIAFLFGPKNENLVVTPQEFPQLTTLYDRRVIEYDSLMFTVDAKKLGSDSISFKIEKINGGEFQLKPEGGTWRNISRNLYNEPVNIDDSTYHGKFYLRFQSYRQDCNTFLSTLTITTGESVEQIRLSAIAPRPTYIQPVEIDSVFDVRAFRFSVEWEQQDDAQNYLLQLYRTKDEQQQYVASFEQAEQFSDFKLENTSFTTNQTGSGKRAIQLNGKESSVTTPVYPLAVSSFDFYLSNTLLNNTTDTELGGWLYVEARSSEAESMELVDSVFIRQSLKGITKTYTFEQPKYKQFALYYKHLGGDGGAVVDDISATLPYTIEYLFEGDSLMLPKGVHNYDFYDLEANTTYYLQMAAEESKGCERHISAWSKPIEIRTLPGSHNERVLNTIYMQGGLLKVYLMDEAEENAFINIYSTDGRLVRSVSVQAGETQVDIDVQGLAKGSLYVVKYLQKNKLKRKSPVSKFFLSWD